MRFDVWGGNIRINKSVALVLVIVTLAAVIVCAESSIEKIGGEESTPAAYEQIMRGNQSPNNGDYDCEITDQDGTRVIWNIQEKETIIVKFIVPTMGPTFEVKSFTIGGGQLKQEIKPTLIGLDLENKYLLIELENKGIVSSIMFGVTVSYGTIDHVSFGVTAIGADVVKDCKYLHRVQIEDWPSCSEREFTVGLIGIQYESATQLQYNVKLNGNNLTNDSVTAVIILRPNIECIYLRVHLSDSIEIGSYEILFTIAGTEYEVDFEVNDIEISKVIIRDAIYDEFTGSLLYSGESLSDNVSLEIKSGNDQIESTIVPVDSGRFLGSINLDQIPNGEYEIRVISNEYEASAFFTVGGEDPYAAYSAYSEDGTVLKTFGGVVDTYVLPSRVKVIEEGAFDYSLIRKFILTHDVDWSPVVKDNVFPIQMVGAEDYDIYEGVTKIPDYLFAHISKGSVTIPSSVEEIGFKAFYDCPNLERVVFAEGSHISTIGKYAFAYNESLNEVVFVSSEVGYSCSIEEGAFCNCGLDRIIIGTEFNLYSIGDASFSNNPGMSMVVGQEDGNLIHIPGTVGYLGQSAFSAVYNTTSGSEPGAKMLLLSKTEVLSSPTFPTSDFVLVFDDNDNLTSIEKDCFSSRTFTSIDLSRCHSLNTIGTTAFRGCLSPESSNLLLPDSLQTIGRGAFICNGGVVQKNDNSIVLPSGLRVVLEYAFDGLFGYISFQEGSELVQFEGSARYDLYNLIDFSNCLLLENLGQYYNNNKIELPVGAYSARMGLYNLGSNTHSAKLSNGTLTFYADSTVVTYEHLGGCSEIVVDPTNPYFRYEGGMLIVDNGAVSKLIYVSERNILEIDDGLKDVHVTSHAVNDVRTLRITESTAVLEKSLISKDSKVENVFINIRPTGWTIPSVFYDNTDGVSIFITEEIDINEINYLKNVSNLYIGYAVGTSFVYVPTAYGNNEISVSCTERDSNTIEFSIKNVNEINQLDFVALGGCSKCEGSHLSISGVGDDTEIFVMLLPHQSYSNGKVKVTISGLGGRTQDGLSELIYEVAEGTTFEQLTVPMFIKSLNDFGYWTVGGQRIESNYVFKGDTTVVASWNQRVPKIYIDNTAAIIRTDDGAQLTTAVIANSDIALVADARDGYQLLSWVVNGVVCGDASSPLLLSGITDDTYISIEYRYSSPSSGLNEINNRGMPTIEDISDIVRSYVVGGYVDTSGSVWEGMTSLPLIVDDYIYVRIAESIYKIESDTGYIVKKVDSASKEKFYHHLGYGSGVIIDYNTSKVYNLDLEQLYVLDREITGVEYYSGKFYTSGKDVYEFTPDDELPGSDEIKTMRKVGTTNNCYGSYGFTRSVFVGDYMYRITASGVNRGLVAMQLSTGNTSYCDLPSLRQMYLDDGWISYSDGYIFVTGYTLGLFGARATMGCDIISYMPVNGLVFGNEGHVEFDKDFAGVERCGFTSEFIVHDGRGFVSISGELYVFDLPDDMSNLDLSILPYRHVNFSFSHGSIVLDTSHESEPGAPVYIYCIPYDSHYYSTLDIACDCGGELVAYDVYSCEKEWNSQAIRSDIDGRMVWYNDSGWLYSYTTADKNVYYFFIEDGDSAKWYAAYGSDAASALASLGKDVATVNAAKIIQSINGHTVSDGITVQMLKSTYGTTDNNGFFNNLHYYSWVSINNLGDSSYSLNHYFRIICGNGKSISVGDRFTYIEDGVKKTYTFANNIGDRSIIGKQLCRGTDAVTVKFMADNREIPGTASVVKRDSAAKIHVPDVTNVGYVPIWRDASGVEILDIYDMVFNTDVIFYLTWDPLPPEYIVSGDVTVVDGGTHWTADVYVKSGVGFTDGLQIKVTALTSSGTVISDISTVSNGSASGCLASSDVTLVYLRIVDEHVDGNLGHVIIEPGATA